MDWAEFLQYTVTGLMVGMLYALIALGFVLVWKSSGVANLALGQLVLISSWFAYGMLVQAQLPVWLSFIFVIVFALLLGWIIERFMLRPLIAQPILSLIAVTLGLSFILEGLVSFIWPKSVGSLPEIIPQSVIHIGPAVVRQDFIWAAGISLLLFGLLSLFFKYYKTGIAMRATADDQMAVQACGIPVTKIFSWSWMLACAMAAVGGILLSNIGDITYGLVHTGLRSFSVVILGGLDSFIGTIVSGPIIGLAESYGEGYLSNLLWKGIGEIIPFVIIIIVMFIRPYGLFGEERIERI
jgi:branched-chain amino acid transport system permease protein